MRRIPGALREARGLLRIGAALCRGALGARRRRLDPARPESWEFRGFSQSREDGLVDYLSRRIRKPNRSFIEIGSGFGIDGNTAWLAVSRRFRGLWVEADPERSEVSRVLMRHVAPQVDYLALRLTAENAAELRARAAESAPDVASVDVDGIDLYLTRALIEAGLRPRVLVVEYNSAFGPERSVTVPYRPETDFRAQHESGLYYGVSITAWRRLCDRLGYRFVTVESSGVNAVFVDPAEFEPSFLAGLRGLDFRENRFQLAHFGAGWEGQSAAIRGQPLVGID